MTSTAATRQKIRVPHFIRGRLIWGEEAEYLSRDFGVPFVTPELKFDELISPRSEPGPAFELPTSEIIDYLVEVGKHLSLDKNEYLQESLEMTLQVSALPRRIIENTFRRPGLFLTKEALEYKLEAAFGRTDVLDGWAKRVDPLGNETRLRAFPPRLVHMLAGNSPSVSINSIADSALVKAVNVFKMPSADPFTTVAVLRTMADLDPKHPVLRSMSAVYWRGGDARVEGVLYRSQYFDKLVAWGGGDAIANAAKYVSPGFHLISFDPKVSMSIVGREAFASETSLLEAAEAVASDSTVLNQDACIASRYTFVEGDLDQVDHFCALLSERLNVDRPLAEAVGPKTPNDIRIEVDGLRMLEPDYRVWGKYDGSGLVVRSPEPVDFHPTNKTVNVVAIESILDAPSYATVATQTVGVYPTERIADLRDQLATRGVQRIVKLGHANQNGIGNPHDAMYPLHRFVNWVVDENG
jgi:hypothetical protein